MFEELTSACVSDMVILVNSGTKIEHINIDSLPQYYLNTFDNKRVLLADEYDLLSYANIYFSRVLQE